MRGRRGRLEPRLRHGRPRAGRAGDDGDAVPDRQCLQGAHFGRGRADWWRTACSTWTRRCSATSRGFPVKRYPITVRQVAGPPGRHPALPHGRVREPGALRDRHRGARDVRRRLAAVRAGHPVRVLEPRLRPARRGDRGRVRTAVSRLHGRGGARPGGDDAHVAGASRTASSPAAAGTTPGQTPLDRSSTPRSWTTRTSGRAVDSSRRRRTWRGSGTGCCRASCCGRRRCSCCGPRCGRRTGRRRSTGSAGRSSGTRSDGGGCGTPAGRSAGRRISSSIPTPSVVVALLVNSDRTFVNAISRYAEPFLAK